MDLTKICSPAKFYLLISLVSLFIYVSFFNKIYKQRYHVLIHIFSIFLWTYLLNLLCNIKHGITISWILVLTPLIFAVMIITFILHYEELDDLYSKESIEGYCNDNTKEFRYYCLKPSMDEYCPGFNQMLDSGSEGDIDDSVIEDFYRSCKSTPEGDSFCDVKQECMVPYIPDVSEYSEIDIPDCNSPNIINEQSNEYNLFKNEICRHTDINICDTIDYCSLKNTNSCVLDLDSITGDESFECNIQDIPLHYTYLHPSVTFDDLSLTRELTSMSCNSTELSTGYLSETMPSADNTNNEDQWNEGLSCDNSIGYYGVANAFCFEENENFLYTGCIHKDTMNNLKRYDQNYLSLVCNELNEAYPDKTIYKSNIGEEPKCIIQIN